MGSKEEGHTGIVIRGYSGKIRPQQAEAGACKACNEPVFVDAHDVPVKTTVDRIEYEHFGCSDG